MPIEKSSNNNGFVKKVEGSCLLQCWPGSLSVCLGGQIVPCCPDPH